MYFYKLNSKQNEQIKLLEMRGSFGITFCPFSNTVILTILSFLFKCEATMLRIFYLLNNLNHGKDKNKS